jgi:cytochrome b pre-mRNA-processing protein 3
MESEHRELGIGDPALGRTVRKLVGKVARRTEAWRQVRSREKDASEAARESLYRNNAPPDALRHCVQALNHFEKMLISAPLEEIEQGKIL